LQFGRFRYLRQTTATAQAQDEPGFYLGASLAKTDLALSDDDELSMIPMSALYRFRPVVTGLSIPPWHKGFYPPVQGALQERGHNPAP
jgi:hypothetical protein